MAVSSSEPKLLSVLRRVGFSLNNRNFPTARDMVTIASQNDNNVFTSDWAAF